MISSPPKVCGIVCEFNPLHAGHRYLIEKTKKKYDIVCGVMSASFVQRGAPAIIDPWTRAQIAISQGMDLVIELPAAYSLQSAEQFALGAVQTLSLIPEVCALSFGIEKEYPLSGLYDLLKSVNHEQSQLQIRQSMQNGLSYRSAMEQAIGIPLRPNAILAFNYIRAIEALKLDWEILPVGRIGAQHDEAILHPECSSASQLRAHLTSGQDVSDQLPGLPKEILKNGSRLTESLNGLYPYLIYADALKNLHLERSVHYEQGMDIRFLRFLKETGNVDQAVELSANKRQSKSRYRRMILTSVLKVPKQLPPVDYLRPLAFNQRGRTLLRGCSCNILQKKWSRPPSESQQMLVSISKKAEQLQSLLNPHGIFTSIPKYYFPGESKE